EIWGLVKHAAVVAQHFEGIGYTAFDHGNIKFSGVFTGRANDANDHDLTDSISNIIEGLATNGAVINGIVDGLLDVSGANQYFNGACSGTISATAAGANNYGITGRIIGEIAGTGELSGDYDGYMDGTGSVEGEIFGKLSSSSTGADATFTGKARGTIRGHITGYVKGILANAGPVNGYVDITDGVLYGEIDGTVTATQASQTIIDGEAEGTFSGTILGQVDAEKDSGRGFFTRIRMGTGTKAPTSGLLELENDRLSADYGLIVNNFINPDANSPSEIHRDNELLDITEEVPDITKHDWTQTTSDGKDYFTIYYAGNEVAIFIPNGQTKGPEVIHFGPNMTDEVPGTITANHISQETVTLRDDYEYKVSKVVYDSEGNSYKMPFTFERVNEKVWLWWAEDPVEGGVAGYGLLEFKADGTINEKAEWPICQSPKDPLTFDSDNGWLGKDKSLGYAGIYFNPPGTPHPYDAGGSPPTEYGPNIVKIAPDFSTLTEFDAFGSNAYINKQNGYPMGILTEEPAINGDGRLVGIYSNGLTRELAQIALAIFNNPEGLSKTGNTMFKQTSNSGQARMEAPGQIRSGGLRTGALETSNVNLTDEFTNMILAQRAFSANVRTITAAEQMMNEILRLRS
ncbi:flagellar hook-basal body complex protein, partial [bacterium]|nr:flagellar hook-basal body complex protein [bacterium]